MAKIKSKSGQPYKNIKPSTTAGQQYIDIIDNIMDGLYRIDAGGRFIFMNKTLREALGVHEKQYFDKHFLDLLDPSYHDRARVNFERIMKGQDGIPYEMKHKDDKGQSRVVEIHSMPILLEGEVVGLWGIARDITDRKLATDTLEKLLLERNTELRAITEQLSEEIRERKHAEIELQKKEKDLCLKTDKIGELSAALKALLNARDQEKTDFAECVLSNIRDLIMPYVDKLKHQENNPINAKHYLDLVEKNLQKIVSPFMKNLKFKYWNLTPKEIQVIDFISEGKGTKEIAELLDLSTKTVEFHRDSIRKKFGLKNQNINLRTYLLSFK